MDYPTINFGSFCSGVGWLDEGFRLAIEYHGIRTRSVFMSEWDSYAATVLRSRMEDAALEPCPIWCGDLREFPAERFRGVVDAAVFGFPCTDISCAGKRQGLEGTRSGLFFDILAKVREMGCWLVAMENVAAITTLGLDAVLGALAESGFDAEWCCLTAAAVGASHKRNRWFCVGVNRAMADTTQRGLGVGGQPSAGDGQSDGGVQALADASDAEGRRDESQRRSHRRTSTGRSGETVGDSDSARLSRRSMCGSERGSERMLGTPGLYAPGPQDPRWPEILRDYTHLAPAIESGVHMLVDGKSMVVDESRADQLRCCGNGVVMLQSAAAFATLLDRIWKH